MPTRKIRPMSVAHRNGNDLKIAVLQEQLKQIEVGLAGVRQDTKEFREDMRRDFAELKAEVVSRADKHEESDRAYHEHADTRMTRHEETDQQNFKDIGERMVAADKATIARESAREAVTKYKTWQWSLLAGAAAIILSKVLTIIEPVIHRLLNP